jgi:hypothetical protein
MQEHIDKTLTELLPFGRIDPFDFGSIEKRPYLMDLYNRSSVIQECFDNKYRQKLGSFKTPKIKHLRHSEEYLVKKYPAWKEVKLSDLEDMDSPEVVRVEIDKLEKAQVNIPAEIQHPRKTHTSCGGMYNRLRPC